MRRPGVKNAPLSCRQSPAKPGLTSAYPRRLLAILFTGLFSAGLLFAGLAANAEPAQQLVGKLRVLTTAREAHSLSSVEAARAYPIHLRAVSTFFDPSVGSRRAYLFVHDATGGIFVELAEGSTGDLPPGTLLDIRGVSGPGEFSPIVAHPQIKVIGHSPLPAYPRRESLTGLVTGIKDSQWVVVDGLVHSVIEYGHYVMLHLAMEGGTASVVMIKEAGATYSGLIDARVRIRATLSPLFNISRQMIGARLLCPGLSSVDVVESPPGDPFNLPIIPIDRLLRWDNVNAMLHRVHLRGRVTLQWPGSSLCIRDATRGICAQTLLDTHVALGDDVDLVGFVGVDNGTAVLTDAIFRSRNGSQPVVAETVTVEKALQGMHDSELIQIDGELIGKDLATTDTTLLLTSGTTVFTASLPKNLAGAEANDWKIGSRLRITGICFIQLDAQRSATGEGMAVPKSFRVLMRSADDVAVLERPSWWTASHALVLLALVLTCTLVALVWVVVLRRRVEDQTILLRESEKRFRHLAQHDSLTGLATRLVFQDRLNVALESARRHRTKLALLMLDLDKFKNINDTLGHQAGDEVLRVTAERFVKAVRKSDTVARMGGDEFVALLPDLRAPHAAESVAAKVVEALSVPIPFAGGVVPVSVSAGICTVSSGEIDADTLLKNVDLALYQAKSLGRNCFQSYTPELPQSPLGSNPDGT